MWLRRGEWREGSLKRKAGTKEGKSGGRTGSKATQRGRDLVLTTASGTCLGGGCPAAVSSLRWGSNAPASSSSPSTRTHSYSRPGRCHSCGDTASNLSHQDTVFYIPGFSQASLPDNDAKPFVKPPKRFCFCQWSCAGNPKKRPLRNT